MTKDGNVRVYYNREHLRAHWIRLTIQTHDVKLVTGQTRTVIVGRGWEYADSRLPLISPDVGSSWPGILIDADGVMLYRGQEYVDREEN